MARKPGVYARDAYRIVREEWKAWFKEQGYKRTKGLELAWHKEHENGDYRCFFMKCDRMGWDELGGSRFTFEFHFSSEEQGDSYNKRIGYLLSKDEREQALKLDQNVSNKISAGIRSYILSHPEETRPENVERLKKSKPKVHDLKPDTGPGDIWFWYLDEKDVLDIAQMLLPALPRMLHEITLGRSGREF